MNGIFLVIQFFNHARFKLMIITKDAIDTAKLKEIYTNIPPINDNISSSGINAMRALLPVEEHREPILFVNQDDIANYDKYTEFITQTIQVFGNLDNIKCARMVLKMDVVLFNILQK